MTAASIKLGQGTPPSSAPGQGVLYFDDGDQQLYVIDAGGNTVGPITGGGGTNATSLQGYDVGIIQPTSGQVLTWDDPGSEWIPGTPAATSLQGAYNKDNLILVGAPGGPANGVIIGLDPAAVGVPATLTVGCDVAGGDAIKVDVGGAATGRGINLDINTSGNGIRVSHGGSGVAVAIEQFGTSSGISITQTSLAAGINVFRSGVGFTAIDGSGIGTPNIVFNNTIGGAARITVLGDPGVGGHYNPRVQLSTGSVNIGTLTRSSTVPLALAPSPTDAEISTLASEDQRCGTVYVIQLISPGALTVGLPDATLHPFGTELTIINSSSSNPFNVKTAGVSASTSVVSPAAIPVILPITVAPDTGLRLISRTTAGWTVIGTF
jgi:hypothetical protein